MSARKETRKYYFLVEGETEKWYLEWLAHEINACETAIYHAKFEIKVGRQPISYAKTFQSVISRDVYYVIDFEGNTARDRSQFTKALADMVAANKTNSAINFALAYSNLTFELWLLLHKKVLRTHFNERKQYLKPLNNAFGTAFKSLDALKSERNFKNLLNKLSLADVFDAVKRAKAIEEHYQQDGVSKQLYGNYSYYSDNPATSLWVPIEQILHECGI